MKKINRSAAIFFPMLLLFHAGWAQPTATCDDLELKNGFQGWSAWYGKWKEDLSTCAIVYTSASAGFLNWRHQIHASSTASFVPCFGNNQVPYVPPGYDHAIQLGNWDDGKEWERLATTINVTNENSLIEVNLAVFLEDPSHHVCRQPRFRIRVLSANGDVIPCGNYEVFASSALPGWGTSYCSGYKPVRFLPWTKISIDLRAYQGQNVQLEFQTMDCSEGGHSGFALFALRCLKSEITATPFCPQQNNSITLSAPEGFGNYSWSNGVKGRVITVDNPQPGQTYTVTLLPYSILNGACQIQMQYTIPPIPTLALSPDSVFCAGSGLSIQASTNLSGYTYTWDNGTHSSSRYVNAGGTYSVTATDGNCTLTASRTVQEKPLPAFQTGSLDAPCFGLDGQAVVTPDDPAVAYQYLWSNNQSGPAQNLPAGQYAVTVSTPFGCSKTAQFNIGQPPQPDLQLPAAAVKCYAAAVQVEASGNFVAYQWSDNSQGPVLNVTEPGPYTVTATDAEYCTVAKTVTVSNHPRPEIDFPGADSTLCPQATTTLTAVVSPTAAAAYQWSVAGLTGSGGTVGPGAYSVTITDTNGCTATEAFNAVELAAPVAGITSDKAHICQPETALLTVSTSHPVATWHWNVPGQNTAQLPVQTGGAYSVTVVDAEGCADTAGLSIVSYAYQAPAITGDSALCPGQQTATLTAPGADIAAYQWSYQQSATASISVGAGGTYTLTVTYATGCKATGAFTVSEHPLPQPLILAPATICQYATAQIGTADPYAAYLWSNGSNASAVEVPAGAYALTVTDGNGCTGSAAVNIAEVALYSVALGPAQQICDGQSATLTLSVQPAGASGLAWLSGGAGPSVPVALIQGQAEWTVVPGATDTFALDSLSIPGYACPLLGLPAATVVEVDKIGVFLTAQLGANGRPLLCPDDSDAAVSAQVQNGQPPYSYAWSVAGAADQVVLPGLPAGAYSVTVTGANGCKATAGIELTAPERLLVAIQAQAAKCYGENNGFISLQKLSGQGQVTFSVNGDAPAAAPAVLTGLAPGTYNIEVSDEFCSWDTSLVFPQLPHYFIEMLDTMVALELPGPYTFRTITNAPLSSIHYSPGSIMEDKDSTVLRPVARPVRDTWVTVEAYTYAGCRLTDSIYFRVRNSGLLYVPSGIHAGSDGENSVFYPFARPDAVRSLSVQVFDRWGNLVFEKKGFLPNDPAAGWNGTYRGRYVAPGVYTWALQVEYVDDTQQLLYGSITVLR